MFEDIKKNGEVLTMGENSENVNNLFIHWSDYGDSYFDLVICYKETERMFGDVGWCAIPSNKINKILSELMNKTKITDVRREKIDPNEWMC